MDRVSMIGRQSGTCRASDFFMNNLLFIGTSLLKTVILREDILISPTIVCCNFRNNLLL